MNRGPLAKGLNRCRWAAAPLFGVGAALLQFEPLTAYAQSTAQRDMEGAILNMCPNLDARSGAVPGLPRASDRTPEEDELNIICANIVFNEGVDAEGDPVDADLDGDGVDDVEGLQLTEEEQRLVLSSLNGEELLAAQQQIGEIRDAQIANISARLTAIRLGLTAPGISLAGLNTNMGGTVLAANDLSDTEIVPAQWTENGFLSRLGVFVTGTIRFGDKDDTEEVVGYDFDTQGVTIGFDYRFDQVVAGMGFGYSRFNADFDETDESPGDQELESDSFVYSLFGSYSPIDNLFFDAIGSVGWSWYDAERRIVVPDNDVIGAVDEQATGDFDAFHWGLAGNVGYEFRVAGASITPVVRVEYLHAKIDGYEEDADTVLALEFDDQTAKSLTTNVGAEVSYPISTGFGVISPFVRAEYIHEFLNDDDGVEIRYLFDPTGTSAFEASTESVDRNYGVVGGGLVGTFAGGWAAFADYDYIVGLDDFTIHTVRLGFRKDF